MSFNVQENEPLILRLTLPEQDDSKYIRAIVKDDRGIALAGSPFTLNNIGDGEYTFKDEVNLLFPVDRLEVTAIYQIYDDDQFQVPTVDYGQQANDVFRNLKIDLSNAEIGGEILDTLERIETLVDDTIKLRDDITISVEDEEEAIEVEIHQDD